MAITINDQVITDDEIYDEFDALKTAAMHGPNPPNCCDQDPEFMSQAKTNLVTKTLITTEARQHGIEVTEDQVEQTILELKSNFEEEDEFYAAYSLDEDSMDDFREKVRGHLVVDNMLNQAIGEIPELTEEEVRQFYEANIEEFSEPERVRAVHVLKGFDYGVDIAAAYATMCDLRRRLQDGADFEAIAKEHSDNYEGMDLGFYQRGQFVEEFEAVTFSMSIGEISPVFVTQYGYHIAKVVEREAASPTPLDTILEEVSQLAADDARAKKVQAYVDALKAKATIVDDDPTEEDDDSDGA